MSEVPVHKENWRYTKVRNGLPKRTFRKSSLQLQNTFVLRLVSDDNVTGGVRRGSAFTRVGCVFDSFRVLEFFEALIVIPLVVCDVLVFIISLIVASSSCDCCRKKSRDVADSYINRDVPYMTDNNIVLQGQLGPFAPPPNYEPSPPAPPAYYNPSPSVPPPTYDAVPSASPLRCDLGFFEPPPSYNQVLLDLQ
ncbi:hypothetical protein DPX16_6768 [Anabarilius grahami]|uniref:Uncharacterized protein n=1 Tax=Anabarilius grahami TaxID=495550 RepID=A0A3N0Y698_ANAGA|nr:hypothetical protein DPX16_6768 [Anabarilius grahami]